MNTLEKIGGLTASDLFLNNTAETTIFAVRTEALAMVFDITTAKGREECISHAAKVTKTKTSIEKLGKALVDPIKAQSKVIDAERKLYRDQLEAIKAEVRKPVTLWEDEQAAAKAKVDQHFFELEQAGVSTSPVTGDIYPEVSLQKKITHIESINLDDFGDRSEEAEILAKAGTTRLTAALQQRKDADELAELRKAAAEKEAKDLQEANDKRIADEAIAKHEAAKAAEKFEKAAEKLENHPVMKEIAVQRTPHIPEEWVEPASEVEARRVINNKIADRFVECSGISRDQAIKIISKIAILKIENIQITY